MNDKYYIPELEEFHEGFKYELMMPLGNFEKQIFGEKINHLELEQFSDDLMKIAHANTRVKYLDQEDIESEEYVILDRENAKEYITFDTKNIFIKKINSPNNSFLKTIILSISNNLDVIIYCQTEGGMRGYGRPKNIFFNGNIKNINELRKIMKQINISK